MDHEQSWRVLDAVESMAREHGVSVPAISLAWLMAKPETSSILIGARTLEQLEDNLRALQVKLSPEEMRRLDEVSQPDWGYPYNFIAMRERW